LRSYSERYVRTTHPCLWETINLVFFVAPAGENDGIMAEPKLSTQIQTFLSQKPPLRLNSSNASGPWEDLGGAGPIDFAIIIGGNDFFAVRFQAVPEDAVQASAAPAWMFATNSSP
jgi:hypothetical protein